MDYRLEEEDKEEEELGGEGAILQTRKIYNFECSISIGPRYLTRAIGLGD